MARESQVTATCQENFRRQLELCGRLRNSRKYPYFLPLCDTWEIHDKNPEMTARGNLRELVKEWLN